MDQYLAKVGVEGSNPFARSRRPEAQASKFRTGENANCRKDLAAGLGVARPERSAKSPSECRSLSEAWGLANLLRSGSAPTAIAAP